MHETNNIQRGFTIAKGYLEQKSTVGKVKMVEIKLRL